jgi:hypothetical protein
MIRAITAMLICLQRAATCLRPLIFAFFTLTPKNRTLRLENHSVLCAPALLRALMAPILRMHDLYDRIAQC